MDWSKFIADNLQAILIIVGGFIVWKTGLLGSIASSSKTLLENREKELAACERSKLDLENRLKIAEEDARALFRNSIEMTRIQAKDDIRMAEMEEDCANARRRVRELEDELRKK